MDVKHEIGGSAEVVLNHEDLGSLATRGFCTIRFGLVGTESKTWVREDRLTEEAIVAIDGDNDMNVYFPTGQTLPVTIPMSHIHAPLDGDRGRVDFYFGDAGSVTVRSDT